MRVTTVRDNDQPKYRYAEHPAFAALINRLNEVVGVDNVIESRFGFVEVRLDCHVLLSNPLIFSFRDERMFLEVTLENDHNGERKRMSHPQQIKTARDVLVAITTVLMQEARELARQASDLNDTAVGLMCKYNEV